MSDEVSKTSELALREAMARLLAGMPISGDRSLTVANLARESGLSRATANRARAVLDEFGAAVEALRSEDREAQLAAKESRFHSLEWRLKARNEENRELARRLNLYAQEIQYLNLRLENVDRESARLRRRLDGL